MLIMTSAAFLWMLMLSSELKNAVDVKGLLRLQFPVQKRVVSSPEHEVLFVSYCDRSMSVMYRPSCGVNTLLK